MRPDSLDIANHAHHAAADTAAHAAPDSIPDYPELDTAAIALWAAHAPADSAAMAVASKPVKIVPPPGHVAGLEPRPRQTYGMANEEMTALIVVLILAAALCLRHARRLFGMLGTELTTIRHGSKNFDVHTVGENRLLVLLGVQLTIFTGVLLQAFVMPGQATLIVTGIFTTLAAGFVLFQLLGYATVTYTFGTDTQRKQAMRGYNACQALLSLGLTIPALAALSYPDVAHYMAITGAVVYIGLRLPLFVKGLRIFYNGPASCLYFILYLCSLEIVPVVLLFSVATALSHKMPL